MIPIESWNQWGQFWADFLWTRCIDSTIVFVIVGLLWILIHKRVSAQFGYLVFLLVLVKLIIPIQIPLPSFAQQYIPTEIPIIKLPTYFFSEIKESKSLNRIAATDQNTNTATSLLKPNRSRSTDEILTETPSVSLSVTVLMMIGWLLIVVFFFIRMLVREWRTHRLVKRSNMITPQNFPIDFESLKEIAGTNRPTLLRTASWVTAPVTYGIFHPVILIPSNFSVHFTPNQIQWILLHELAHINRRDAIIVLFQKLMQFLFFFHPVVWIVNRIIDQQREFVCDDIALQRSGVPRYDCGEGFLAVVQFANHTTVPSHSHIGMLHSNISIKHRLIRILDPGRPIYTSLTTYGSICFSLTALLVLPFGSQTSNAFYQDHDEVVTPVGLFDNFVDIGAISTPGVIEYNNTTHEYLITGNKRSQGQNDGDHYFFAYRKLTGNWRMEAVFEWPKSAQPDIGRIGLMCRESLDPYAKHVTVLSGPWIRIHYRQTYGAMTINEGHVFPDYQQGNDIRFRLSRSSQSDQFVFQWYDESNDQWLSQGDPIIVDMPNEALVGLVCNSLKQDTIYPKSVIKDVKFVSMDLDTPSETAVLNRTMGRRSFSTSILTPGEPISVIIDVWGKAEQISITEIPPPGWEVIQISDGSAYVSGKIIWNRSTFTESDSFNYVIRPPTTMSEPGFFQGDVNGSEITGNNKLIAPQALGVFENHVDFGDPIPGSATYNPQTGVYELKGSMNPSVLSGYCAYKKVSKDFILKARIEAKDLNNSTSISGAGILLFDKKGTFYAAKASSETGNVSNLWGAGGSWNHINSGIWTNGLNGLLVISRSGSIVKTSFIDSLSEHVLEYDTRTLNFEEPVYISLFVQSADKEQYAIGRFWDVELQENGQIPE